MSEQNKQNTSKSANKDTTKAIAGIATGGILGGTAGYFLADAFWDQPSRLQKLITGVSGLLIGSALGAYTIGSTQTNKSFLDRYKVTEQQAKEIASFTPTQKMWLGVTDTEGNAATNTVAKIIRTLRQASPINQEGQFTWMGSILPSAATYGFDRTYQKIRQRRINTNNIKALTGGAVPINTKGGSFFNWLLGTSDKNYRTILSTYANNPTVGAEIQDRAKKLSAESMLPNKLRLKGRGGGMLRLILDSLIALASGAVTNNLSGQNETYNAGLRAIKAAQKARSQ